MSHFFQRRIGGPEVQVFPAEPLHNLEGVLADESKAGNVVDGQERNDVVKNLAR
jgi:hypothetical protein